MLQPVGIDLATSRSTFLVILILKEKMPEAFLGKKLSLSLKLLALAYLLSKLTSPAPSDLEKEEITNIRAL